MSSSILASLPVVEIIMTVAKAVATLCIVAIPFWALGVPGNPSVNTPYVRGWKMGFLVILAYPIATFMNDVIQWDPTKKSIVAVVFLVVAAMMLWHSFRVMDQT